MNDGWRDKPHWVLRFPDYGGWELTGPDGEVKSTGWMGDRAFTVKVSYNDIAEFEAKGVPFTGVRVKA